jgi:hypothetical protein
LVFFSNEVLYWDFDIFKGDIRGAGRPHSLTVHPTSADATEVTLNEKNGDAVHAFVACPYCSREVIAPDTIGDPLLLAIDDVVLPILTELSFASQVRHVRACIWFRDGKADPLVAVQYTWNDTVDKGLLAMLHKRWAANAITTNDIPHESARSRAGELVRKEHLVEQIPLLRGHGFHSLVCKMRRIIVDSQQTC